MNCALLRRAVLISCVYHVCWGARDFHPSDPLNHVPSYNLKEKLHKARQLAEVTPGSDQGENGAVDVTGSTSHDVSLYIYSYEPKNTGLGEEMVELLTGLNYIVTTLPLNEACDDVVKYLHNTTKNHFVVVLNEYTRESLCSFHFETTQCTVIQVGHNRIKATDVRDDVPFLAQYSSPAGYIRYDDVLKNFNVTFRMLMRITELDRDAHMQHPGLVYHKVELDGVQEAQSNARVDELGRHILDTTLQKVFFACAVIIAVFFGVMTTETDVLFCFNVARITAGQVPSDVGGSDANDTDPNASKKPEVEASKSVNVVVPNADTARDKMPSLKTSTVKKNRAASTIKKVRAKQESSNKAPEDVHTESSQLPTAGPSLKKKLLQENKRSKESTQTHTNTNTASTENFGE